MTEHEPEQCNFEPIPQENPKIVKVSPKDIAESIVYKLEQEWNGSYDVIKEALATPEGKKFTETLAEKLNKWMEENR